MPDAIYAVNDMVAIGIVNRFKELKIRVPDDVAVVGIDNNVWTTVTTPQISSVSIMGDEVARLATELRSSAFASKSPANTSACNSNRGSSSGNPAYPLYETQQPTRMKEPSP